MNKILCLIDSLGAGGAQRQIVGLASFLKKRGYDVLVAIYHEDLFYADVLLNHDVPYVYLYQAKRHSTRIFYIANYIRKIRPDWVVSYLETPSICACVARILNHRFKLIVSERNTTQNTGLREKIRFTLFRLADYVVPNAYAQSEYIKNTFPKLANKTITIPNFVDLQYFTPSRHRIRKTTPEIIVVASIWPSKNTFGFIDAIGLLKERGLSFHVSWYGLNTIHKDYINKCLAKIANINVADYIELKEKTTHIKDRYQEADYFCLPSFYEGTPNVICESMACGLPVACSDVCDNSRYVTNDENGFLFNPNDVSSIVVAIEKLLLLDNLQYNAFCVRSREKAEELFSEETFITNYVKLLEQ